MAIDINKIKEEYEEQDNNKDFAPLPVGDYNCFVFSLEGRESSTGNPMIEVELKIATGEYEGRRQWTYLVLTPKAFWKVEEFFNAVSYDLDNLPDKVDTPEEVVAHIREDVIGEKVTITVNHREYQGEKRDNVKKVSKPKTDFDVGGEVDDDTPF